MRAGLAAALVAAAASASGCGGAAMGFDKAGWAAERGNHRGENARASMVGALDGAGVTPGASRGAVREILGAPDSTGPEADIWYLGRSRSGPSFEQYRVDYSPAGIVTAAGVRRS